MFDWIAIGFGASLGVFLFVVALIFAVLVLCVIGGLIFWSVAKLHKHNDGVAMRWDSIERQAEERWGEIDRANRRLLREAQIVRLRPLLTPIKPMSKQHRDLYYGDPDENLRLHFPGANIKKGGFYRP